jgi:hypothetical protein
MGDNGICIYLIMVGLGANGRHCSACVIRVLHGQVHMRTAVIRMKFTNQAYSHCTIDTEVAAKSLRTPGVNATIQGYSLGIP